MSVVRKQFVVSLLSLVLCVALTQIASAQRRGGRGFFGVDRVRLVTVEKVQLDLKMTDDQKALAKEVSEKLSADRRGLFQGGGGGDFNASMEKAEKLSAEASKKITAKLDEAQNKRLTEIYVQQNGTNALVDEAVVKALKINDEQQKKLKAAREENRRAGFAAFRDFQNMSDEERNEAMEKLGKESEQRMLEPLTDEQKEQFGTLKGKELEIDRSQLFRFGGRRGGGGNRPN